MQSSMRGINVIPAQIKELGEVVAVNFIAYGPGIYFLMDHDEVAYIGKTKRVLSRLEEHKKAGKVFDAVFFMECEENHLSLVESLAIHFLKPSQNGDRKYTNQKHAPHTLKSIIDLVKAA